MMGIESFLRAKTEHIKVVLRSDLQESSRTYTTTPRAPSLGVVFALSAIYANDTGHAVSRHAKLLVQAAIVVHTHRRRSRWF